MSEGSALRREVEGLARQIAARAERPLQFMEVCGTHAHAVGRFGLRQLLPEEVRLLSGPGCPVCVTAPQEIDWALELAGRPEVIVASFGDMMRVPGSQGSLTEKRAEGARVQVVYSPLQAVELAAAHPEAEVVLLGVGFETTAPTVALTARAAREQGRGNFSILCMHKLIPPAMRALLKSGEVRLDGFLCPGHVSTVLGLGPYEEIAAEWGTPCTVAGFEPQDILRGLLSLVEQAVEGRAEVDNQYPRAVRPEGNPAARAAVEEVFEVGTAAWRGLGELPESGLRLREEYAELDAVRRWDLRPGEAREHPLCRCGEVLRGVLSPEECGAFGGACTPERPLGPCMVSSEGACAAALRYGGEEQRGSGKQRKPAGAR